RIPALRLARPETPGAGSLRGDHLGDGEARPRTERDTNLGRASGAESRLNVPQPPGRHPNGQTHFRDRLLDVVSVTVTVPHCSRTPEVLGGETLLGMKGKTHNA